MPSKSIPESQVALRALAERWRTSALKERQAFQTWFHEFCDALGVERPGADGGDSYCFELPRRMIRTDDSETVGFIDCWKAGHFAMEAKASGSGFNDALLRRAFTQLHGYVHAEHGTIPPYLMVVDVPHELIIWDGWSGRFGGFARGERIRLETLHQRPETIALLHEIFTNPAARDPRGKAQQVTREIAGKLAQLAATFENRGHSPEQVARFLMRCVFCFFAEDVGLLPKRLFHRTLESARDAGGPERVAGVLTSLWRTMDTGGDFGADLIDRFNGHFFRSVESLPLEADDVTLLIEAAGFVWTEVEPSIFGTLLVRALDPEERHRLGAEYTPREYIERLVEPTVLEPLRERWNAVQARVVQLEQAVDSQPAAASRGRKAPRQIREAIAEVREFHAWLRGLRFLDPACGSGNFLYVTMAAVKELELEVIREIERLGAREGVEQTEQILEEVHPRQFHGIEVSWWAREIAELTLWIGYHQFWRRTHGGRTPPIPILEDTGTIECRDAILAWDEIVHRPERDRPDPTPRIEHPVTGELVPDPEARLPYMEYVGARPAEWPEADFIVGNPPYLGNARMRDAFGDGYTECLRAAYPDVAEGVDLVMYWWFHAANAIAEGRCIRAGLITTNSVVQPKNRTVVASGIAMGAVPVWTVRDHPWVAETDGAAVRVAMSVLARPLGTARIGQVLLDGTLSVTHISTIHSDLSISHDIVRSTGVALRASSGLSHRGPALVGSGFVVKRDEIEELRRVADPQAQILKELRNGRDLTQRVRGHWVIDFGLRSEIEAREFPVLYDRVRATVYPERQAQSDPGRKRTWWQFGRSNEELRSAVTSLDRVIVTPMTAKHRFFTWLPAHVVADQGIITIATPEAEVLGVLSSRIHISWALGTGGTLEDRPRYNNTICFDPFPFPDLSQELRDRIGALAERLDTHRKDALARDAVVTMTGMYNVVEKLRSGERLTPKERRIHEIAACGVLRDLHDELDALVAEAYGWPWPMEREEILERLVALHDQRVEEERRGVIRWLRPEYQIPRFAPEGEEQQPTELDLDDAAPPAGAAAAVQRLGWPEGAVEQLEAITALAGRGVVTVEALVECFDGASRKLVARHLETLQMLGEVSSGGADSSPAEGKVQS